MKKHVLWQLLKWLAKSLDLSNEEKYVDVDTIWLSLNIVELILM